MMMAAGGLPIAEDEVLLPERKELNESEKRRGGEAREEKIARWTEGKNEAESVNPSTRGVGHSVGS